MTPEGGYADPKKANYVVLKKDASNLWEQITAQYASSARAAIRMTADGGGGAGVYIAVPARSWKQETVKVETKQAIKFS